MVPFHQLWDSCKIVICIIKKSNQRLFLNGNVTMQCGHITILLISIKIWLHYYTLILKMSGRAPENFIGVCTACAICYAFKVSLILYKASYVHKVGITSRTVIPICIASHMPQLNHVKKALLTEPVVNSSQENYYYKLKFWVQCKDFKIILWYPNRSSHFCFKELQLNSL